MSLTSERIDLRGASGVVYSFHRADPAQLAHRAGAYAIVRSDGAVALVAEAESLETAVPVLEQERMRSGEARLFIRYIIRRQTRLDELQDLLAALPSVAGSGPAASAAA